MPARQFRKLLQHFARADRSCGIIRIDEHNRAGAGSNLPLNIQQIRLPPVFFVEVVGIQLNAQLRQDSRIQRVVRAGSKDVFSRINQGSQTNVHTFAHA